MKALALWLFVLLFALTVLPADAGSDPSHHGDYPTLRCFGTVRGDRYTALIGIGGNHPQISAEDRAWALQTECPVLILYGAREHTEDRTISPSEVTGVTVK